MTPIDWATAEAARLRTMENLLRSKEGAYSTLADRRPACAPAIEFLVRQAPGSTFLTHALYALDNEFNDWPAVLAVACQLENWVTFVESGMAASLPFEAQARVEAATDLMEQVHALLDDRDVHVAAPVVLAGAALEEFLRSLVSRHGLTITGRPAISSYAEALRAADKLSRQDVKDVTAWAGLRNDAAHGHFESIEVPNARLMAQGIDLFLRQHQEDR